MRGTTNPLRVRNRDALVPLISRIFRKKKANYWQELLTKRGVPATPVYTIRNVTEDPHLRSRKMIVERRGLRHLESPVKFSKTSARPLLPAPRLGEHTSRILKELRYSGGGIGKLRRMGALG